MNKTIKNRWFISLMICVGIIIGLAIAYTTEIIVFKKFETEKITNADNNIKYEDLQRYAKGSHTVGESGY